jgi:hypothetical protein
MTAFNRDDVQDVETISLNVRLTLRREVCFIELLTLRREVLS